MIIYRFKAYDSKGKIHKGNLFMPSEEEVIAFLLKNNLTPIEVKLLPQSIISKFLFKIFFRITFQQKLFLMRNLSLLLKSGLSLDRGLKILSEEASGGLKDFLFYLSYNLQRGEPIYKTFASFPQVFTDVEIETIKAGEVSGNLIYNLEKLTESLERQKEIKSEIISNTIYPAIILVLSAGVIFLLVTFVMPRISMLLSQLAEQPPLLTRILLKLSNIINQNLQLIVILMIFFVIAIIFIFLLKKARQFLFKFFIKLPLFSKIYLFLTLGQFLFILRSLLGAGLSLNQSLKLAADTTSHPRIKTALYRIERNLRSGKSFGDALKEEEEIPLFLSSVLSIASETGTLENTLKIMEDFYISEFRNFVRNILNLLQPALLVFVGGVVGFVALAVLVPIYQQISNQLQMQQGAGRGQMP